MNNLAEVLRNQAKYEPTEEMYREVLRLSEVVLDKGKGCREQNCRRSLLTTTG